MIKLVFHLEYYCIVYCHIRVANYLKIGWCLLVQNVAKQKILNKKIIIFCTWLGFLEWLHTWSIHGYIYGKYVFWSMVKVLKTSQKKFTVNYVAGQKQILETDNWWALHIAKIRLTFLILLLRNFLKNGTLALQTIQIWIDIIFF